MISTLLVGTSNPHKLAEYRRLAQRQVGRGLAVDFQLRSWSEMCAGIVVEENGETLRDNAMLKASTAAQHARECAIADDTGLFVAALSGAPGVRSGRYAGENAAAGANRAKLVQQLQQLSTGERFDAEFRCHMVLADAHGEVLAEGSSHCCGQIVLEERGSGGFGYDTLFHIRELHCTLAELSPIATDMLGHRGRAWQRLWTAMG